jgi:Methyltransferase domain
MPYIVLNSDGSAEDYFLGRRFSDNLIIEIRPDGEVLPRTERLAGLVQGRSVLHIGCCDHTPILKQRLANGLWLHARLTKVAQRCLGIDIDSKAVEQVKSTTGFDNLIAGDITKPGIDEIASSQWDVALFGDVLEHVHAPVDFLSAFRNSYGSSVNKIIVSVPNNMRVGNAMGALRNRETINSDHCFEFSPFTLAKVVTLSGFRLEQFYYSSFFAVGFPKSIIYKRRPYLAHTLIAVASVA